MQRFSQSPTDPAFVQSPYAFYDQLRSSGDLAYWDDYAMPMASTARAVSALLRDRRFGREPVTPVQFPDHLAPFYAVEAHSMLELEPPRHTRLRGLVLRAFTSRRIAAMGPDIDALAHQMIDAFPRDTPFDLLTSFGQPIPVLVIARLLGVPDAMADQLLAWSNAMVSVYTASRTRTNEDAAALAARDFSAFLTEYIDSRRTDPRDDLITHLIAAEQDGEKLSKPELITTCILLLNAGHEATVHSLGNGVKALLDHGSGAPRDGIDARVEEILRHDPPLHLFTRTAYEDMDLFGHHFERGDQVGLLLAAANRDPAAHAQPHLFDPTRPAKPNASFGGGLHFCVGAPLARMELARALPILFDRCPNLRLAAPPVYANKYHFHGLERLMVRI